MSLVHAKLYQSDDLGRVPFASYTGDLMESLFRSYGADRQKIRYSVDAEGVDLTISVAAPVGLLLSEIASNALKYAFPKGRAGTLAIALRREPNGGYALTVQDDGVGLPPNFEERAAASLGVRLIDQLVQQMNGTLQRSSSPVGVTYHIAFPAEPER